MERTITSEERIRRAEEIYQRRRMQNDIKVPTSQVNAGNKIQYGMLKKVILQVLICMLIYFIFYLIKNSNYIFSEEVVNKTREFLSYDINFQGIYIQTEKYYNEVLKPIINNQSDSKEEQEQNVNEQVNEEGGIGGGEEGVELLNNEIQQTSADEIKEDKKEDENQKPLSQMEIDANDIKANYNLILPLKGTVTSRFGSRTPTDIVSANHAGIDIGVNEGTVFTASMEGTVTSVSSEGSYGNHIYIQKDDVTTLYAHCKTIYLKQGDTVVQGQEIGEVGSTGKATGPHLHFEIRKANRVVNPEYILAF